MSDLTPLMHAALAAAAATPERCLVRKGQGWVAPGSDAPAFTYRLLRAMERAWLLEFDDAASPTRATLTRKGAAAITARAA